MHCPPLLYGTAWKEDRTTDLVIQALEAGFRGIDTANQRKHYHEAGVGEALAAAYEGGAVSRSDLWLQTKFTHPGGQDHRIPYDTSADPSTWVEQSFASSCEHLGTDTIDSYVLHGPDARRGFSETDQQVWQAMEALVETGQVRAHGASNVSAEQLSILCEQSEVPVAACQDRCFAQMAWNLPTREVCREHGVSYQGFSLLTANPTVVRSAPVASIAAREEATPAQVVLALARHLDMVVLTGTTDPAHMTQDLDLDRITLDDDEVRALEWLAVQR